LFALLRLKLLEKFLSMADLSLLFTHPVNRINPTKENDINNPSEKGR